MHADEIESLALWLHWTAHSAGHAALLGDLIRAAAREAREIYVQPGGADEDEAGDMPALVDRFAARWEDCERLTRQADSPAPGQPAAPDPWGFGRGTQAARINELLAADQFRTINELFAELVRDFPGTTRARVNTHVQVLRQRHRPLLLERRHGRRVSFRLVTEVT